MEGRLHIIGEGGAYTTLVYLVRHGIRPHNYIDNLASLEDIIPYLSKEDTVMLLIRGLTDYTVQEVYSIVEKIQEHKEKLKRVIIMSNIPLGNIKTPYYLYEGDLMYGLVKYIDEIGKEFPVDREGNPIHEEKRKNLFSFIKVGTEKEKRGNVVIRGLVDRDATHKPMVHSKPKEKKREFRGGMDFVEHIEFVDMYKNSKGEK